VVAELSQRELDAGQLWCSLFTDAANPTSNHIYTEIGYEPRCDFRYLTLTW
jgi:predicted GNAT family acetyltransferase